MGQTTIEWTQETWNPTRGCSMAKGSEDNECLNCYAARFAARNMPGHRSPTTGQPFAILRDSGPRWTGRVELIEKALEIPHRRRKPTTWFVDSMSDLFDEGFTMADIFRVHVAMLGADRHTYQILTKRPENMRDFYLWWDRTCPGHDTPKNLWLGTSIGVRKNLYRADILRGIPASVRFLSLEPLLEDLGTLDLRGIDWVIVGGESGPGARPFDLEWARSIVQQCKAAGVAAFVKQLGAKPINTEGCGDCDPCLAGEPCPYVRTKFPMVLRDRKGGSPDEWPADLRVRQMPGAQR
jgi:protein gp37